MTKQEAIKQLQALMLMIRTPEDEPISDLYFACELAISALQEQIQREDDGR